MRSIASDCEEMDFPYFACESVANILQLSCSAELTDQTERRRRATTIAMMKWAMVYWMMEQEQEQMQAAGAKYMYVS